MSQERKLQAGFIVIAFAAVTCALIVSTTLWDRYICASLQAVLLAAFIDRVCPVNHGS